MVKIQKEEPQQPGKSIERNEFESLKWVVYFVLVITGIGLVGFITQNFIASATAFNNLSNQINAQNSAIQVLSAKIDSLNSELQQLKQSPASTR